MALAPGPGRVLPVIQGIHSLAGISWAGLCRAVLRGLLSRAGIGVDDRYTWRKHPRPNRPYGLQ